MPLTLLAFSGHDAILPDRDQRLPQDSHTDNIATLGGAKMLKVYVTDWCPICERTLGWMRENEIPFVSINIEYQPPVVREKVIEANDGKDWRVPTFEYGGKWLTIASFNPERLKEELAVMGAIKSGSAGKSKLEG